MQISGVLDLTMLWKRWSASVLTRLRFFASSTFAFETLEIPSRRFTQLSTIYFIA
jgi:hypothetical protein